MPSATLLALLNVALASVIQAGSVRQLRGGQAGPTGTANHPSMDCTNINAVLTDVNRKCCNGGNGAGSGHRLLQGNTDASSSCVLDACTTDCARVFVALMENCQSDLPVTGSGFSIVSQIAGADDFLATCQNVLHPPPPAGSRWLRVGNQFMAGDPGMRNSHHLSGSVSSGSGASGWGYWRYDPGMTGVRFSGINSLEQTGRAPAGWQFNEDEWWVEEHGLIMDPPEPLPEGRYKLVWLNRRAGATSDVTLTVTGDHWELDPTTGATIYDVTHLPCRSAKYTTPADGRSCLPEHINQRQFPVTPGAVMPTVPGCDKLDYAVFFVSAVWV